MDAIDYRDDPKVKELAKSVVRATRDAFRIARGEKVASYKTDEWLDDLIKEAEGLKNEH